MLPPIAFRNCDARRRESLTARPPSSALQSRSSEPFVPPELPVLIPLRPLTTDCFPEVGIGAGL
jgi:hypothetical protein